MNSILKNYLIGQVYDFKVKKKFSSQTELIDETTGINAYLQNTENLKLFKGQIVRCRVTELGNNRPLVELVDLEDFSYSTGLTTEKLTELLTKQNIGWGIPDFVNLLLTDEKEETFEEQCHNWINKLVEHGINLSEVRQDCSDILELSDLLDISGNSQREFYQERLTQLIELLGYYLTAEKIITEGKSEEFVDTLFNKLKVSGFIYHPDKHFKILASLFMRRPEIMRRRIAQLLQIVCDRDILIWKKEPFNSALSKLLELYIHECINKIDREKGHEKESLIDNIITSLTIQLLLAAGLKESEVIDMRLTTARLCTIASYLNQGDATHLLDNAFGYLFNEDIKFLKIGLESINNAHYIIANFNPGGEVESASSFSNGFARLYIDKKGISLRPAFNEIVSYPVFASDSGFWKGMQVYITSRPEHQVFLMSKSLKGFRDIWKDIENDLFNSSSKRHVVISRTKHHVGDQVEISFIKQDLFERSRFECHIEDEIGGKGFITIADIVPYSVMSPTLSMFLNNGARRVYPARITEVDADGNFHFSMSEFIREESAGFYYDEDGNIIEEDIFCRLGKTPHYLNGLAPAISNMGLSVSVSAKPEFRSLKPGTIVKCRFVGPSHSTTHIDCEIIEIANDFEHDFSVTDAFATLMADFAYRDSEESISPDSDPEVRDSEKELDESYVRQVIQCFDRLAMLETDYVRSYNYLAFARLLCRLISWESQAVYYKGRMDIISMLHYFDVNSEIDEAELSQLEMANSQLFEKNKPLQERFMQLQAVSYLGKPEHTDDLYKLSSRNPLLKTLSQLVIAYNVVTAENMVSVADSIHEKIKELLNLKGFGSRLKKYADGIESETVEFKTSFIYPPKDAENQNQKETILKVVNSFLNTKGGTLYIGVNDAGYGVGVENDLVAEPYFREKEKYILDVTNTVILEFGKMVAPFVKVYFDPDNSAKDVLIVEVSPTSQKVPMRTGSFFIRTNSSILGYTRDEFAEVIKGLAIAELSAMTNHANEDIDVEVQLLQPENEENDEREIEQKSSYSDKIPTSRIRRNVLESYMDDYVEPVAFLKFIEPNEFTKLSRYDYDYESPLTLTVLADEVDGYLILGYENGHIVKIPLDEILVLDEDTVRKRFDGSKLIFASVAQSDNDLILSVIKENKNNPNIVIRADKVGEFDEEQLQDDGRTPCNENLIGEIVTFDIVPASMAEEFRNITNLDLTRAGHTFNNGSRMKSIIRKLRSLGFPEY